MIDAEKLGEEISRKCKFNGEENVKVFQAALEDASYHTFNKTISKEWIKEKESWDTMPPTSEQLPLSLASEQLDISVLRNSETTYITVTESRHKGYEIRLSNHYKKHLERVDKLALLDKVIYSLGSDRIRVAEEIERILKIQKQSGGYL